MDDTCGKCGNSIDQGKCICGKKHRANALLLNQGEIHSAHCWCNKDDIDTTKVRYEANSFDYEQYKEMTMVRIISNSCQATNHIQQVAYSSFHDALTQICFTCKTIRTNIQVKFI